MANEHFFPGDYFSSSSSAAAALPGGLDVAAAYGMPSWAVADQMMMVPAVADSAAARFDSALSSLVSSPGGGGGGALVNGGGGDDMAIGDLIGRLGSICNGASANNSCYSTPLSSPPRGPPASAAAAAFRGYAGALETGRLSRVSSSKSLGAAAAALETSEAEMSPTTTNPAIMPDQPPAKPSAAAGEVPARKRKSSAKGKATSSSLPAATAATNASPKRSKITGDDGEAAAEEEEKEKPELPIDYIHVRARRGQATDSHSLAERVRRERISERMKLLQSLVPGCNKITGKALMLDEIINYVQSLQRQVEFLSMKLATMNPQLDFDGHYLPSKDIRHISIPRYPSSGPTTATTFSYTDLPVTADPFTTYNYWDLNLHTTLQTGATATIGLSQDGPVAAMTVSSSSFSHHPHSPRGFYGGGGGGGRQGTTVNHMKAEP